MSGRVLALDCATHVGYAFDSFVEGVPECETFLCPKPFGDARQGFEYGRMFSGFRRWLVNKIDQTTPDIIAYEAPIQSSFKGKVTVKRSHYSERILFGLSAIVEEVAETVGLRVYEANVQEVKASFVRAGASKEEMIARCRQLGWKPVDDNAADACALWALIKALEDPKWAPRALPLFAGRI